MAAAIQHVYRVWAARQERKLLVASRQLAAHQIQRCFRAWRFRKYARGVDRARLLHAPPVHASAGIPAEACVYEPIAPGAKWKKRT